MTPIGPRWYEMDVPVEPPAAAGGEAQREPAARLLPLRRSPSSTTWTRRIPLPLALMVAEHEGRVLLVHDAWRREWELPGGTIEDGETRAGGRRPRVPRGDRDARRRGRLRRRGHRPARARAPDRVHRDLPHHARRGRGAAAERRDRQAALVGPARRGAPPLGHRRPPRPARRRRDLRTRRPDPRVPMRPVGAVGRAGTSQAARVTAPRSAAPATRACAPVRAAVPDSLVPCCSPSTPPPRSSPSPSTTAATCWSSCAPSGAMKHGEQLAPLIEQAMREAGIVRQDLTAIAVGVGPGPFTGLRVGLVTARTLGFVLEIPVYGVCTLDVLAVEAVDTGVGRRRRSRWRPTPGARRSTSRRTTSTAPASTGPVVEQPADGRHRRPGRRARARRSTPTPSRTPSAPAAPERRLAGAGGRRGARRAARPRAALPAPPRRGRPRPAQAGLVIRPAGARRRGAAIADLELDNLGADAWSAALVAEGVSGELPTVSYLVAEVDGRVVGYAVASVVADIAELQRIAVDRAHRRTGLATALLEGVLSLARGRRRRPGAARGARGQRRRARVLRGGRLRRDRPASLATTATAPPRSSCSAPSTADRPRSAQCGHGRTAGARDRDVVRRDRGRDRPRPHPARRRRRQQRRGARALRRRGARGRQPGPPRGDGADDRAGLRDRRRPAARRRRDRGHQRSRARRGPARRGRGGQGARDRARQAAVRRQPPRLARRRRPARARPAARALPGDAGQRRALQPAAGRGRHPRRRAAGRHDRRRGGGGLRQGRAAAGAAVPRRARTSTGWRARGTACAVDFPRGLTSRRDLERHRFDFSFSGLKTAVARWVEARERAGEPVPVADVAASASRRRSATC